MPQTKPKQTKLVNDDGMIPLSQYWERWQADCHPKFPTKLFDDYSVAQNKNKLESFSSGEKRFLQVAADSPEEALAFLHRAFPGKESENMYVIEKSSAQIERVFDSKDIIPIFTDHKIALDFAKLDVQNKSIHIAGKVETPTGNGLQIFLHPLPIDSFIHSFSESSVSDSKIRKLHKESGGSLTVLRQRLSKNLKPAWNLRKSESRKLIPLLFAGAWNMSNSKDIEILCRLSDCKESELDATFNKFKDFSADSPVWQEQNAAGVCSKIDLFFNLATSITKHDLENFYHIAYEVLSAEDSDGILQNNPNAKSSLQERVSPILKRNLCDSLAMLSALNSMLEHTKVDTEGESGNLINRLIVSVNLFKYENRINLLKLAEAAPEVFLNLIEKEVIQNKMLQSQILGPNANNTFVLKHFYYILRVLEVLAWYPKHLQKVVKILAELATSDLNGKNNSPIESLNSIFRYADPQTCADYEQRKDLFEALNEEYPDVAWPILKSQVVEIDRFTPTSQPAWYNQALNQITTEYPDFRKLCFDKLLTWKKFSMEKIFDLIDIVNAPAVKNHQKKVLDLILKHSLKMNDESKEVIKSSLREKLLARNHSINHDAGKVLESLTPDDIYLRHKWIFSGSVPASAIASIKDWKKYNKELKNMKGLAIKEVYDTHGLSGIKKFAETVQFTLSFGEHLVNLLSDGEIKELIHSIFENRGSPNYEDLFSGLLLGHKQNLKYEKLEKRIGKIVCDFDGLSDKDKVFLLTLMPFKKSTWDLFDHGKIVFKNEEIDVESEYWRSVVPSRWITSSEDRVFAIQKFLSMDMDAHALKLFDFRNLGEMDHKLLFEVVKKLSLYEESTFDKLFNYTDFYMFQKIIEVLESSEIISRKELSAVELSLVGKRVLDKRSAIKSLNEEFSNSPEMFCRFIKLRYGNSGTSSLNTHDKQFVNDMTVFMSSNHWKTPGVNANGSINYKKFMSWIAKARKISPDNLIGYVDAAIGELIGRSPPNDEEWPCEEIADVIEENFNKVLLRGVMIGRLNGRGKTSRMKADGGEQEDIKAKYYDKMARKYHQTHPAVSRMLKDFASDFTNEANRWNEAAKLHVRGNYA